MFTLKSEKSLGGGAVDRRVKCEYCGKVFKSHNYLKMHEKWHKGELEHKCNVCNRAFRFPSELKKHMSIHSGELPYKCDHCGKSFGRVGTLHEHMWVDHQQNMASFKVERRGIYNRHHNMPLKIEPARENMEPKFGSDWENDLFRNISPSEISFRENSMISDMRAMDTNPFSQLQRDYGVSVSIPDFSYFDPDNDAQEPGSYAGESILGLNQEFHQVRNARIAYQEEEKFQDDWREESSLPTGWKSNSEGHFMSPTGQTFGSRRAVQEFLSRQEPTSLQIHENSSRSDDKEMENIDKQIETTEASNDQIETNETPNDGGCQKCLLIKEYEKNIAELQHSHN